MLRLIDLVILVEAVEQLVDEACACLHRKAQHLVSELRWNHRHRSHSNPQGGHPFPAERGGGRAQEAHAAQRSMRQEGLRAAELDVLGFAMPSFLVHVFDLGHDDIDGLVGLNFLSALNYEVRSAERRILVEKIEP
jgi:hypothetical protein